MKKNVFISLFLVFSLVSVPSINSTGLTEPELPNIASITSNPLAGWYYCGRIGGDNNAWLEFFDNNNGKYIFLNMTRNLRFVSYNNKTHSLVLNSYERGTGKYLGKFVGKYYNARYTGTFTNYKGGKVTFDLSDCGGL